MNARRNALGPVSSNVGPAFSPFVVSADGLLGDGNQHLAEETIHQHARREVGEAPLRSLRLCQCSYEHCCHCQSHTHLCVRGGSRIPARKMSNRASRSGRTKQVSASSDDRAPRTPHCLHRHSPPPCTTWSTMLIVCTRS
jgi:hypothetical protein